MEIYKIIMFMFILISMFMLVLNMYHPSCIRIIKFVSMCIVLINKHIKIINMFMIMQFSFLIFDLLFIFI